MNEVLMVFAIVFVYFLIGAFIAGLVSRYIWDRHGDAEFFLVVLSGVVWPLTLLGLLTITVNKLGLTMTDKVADALSKNSKDPK